MTENNGRSFYDDDIDDEPEEETGPLAFIRKHPIATGLAAVVIGSVIFTGLGGGVSVPSDNPSAVASSSGNAATSNPLPTASSTPTSTPTPTATFSPKYLVENGPDQAPTLPEWQSTATGFANAWANPEVGKDAWLANIRPFVDDSIYANMEYVDINTVPVDKVVEVTESKNDQMGVVFNVRFQNPELKMSCHTQWDPQKNKWVIHVISR